MGSVAHIFPSEVGLKVVSSNETIKEKIRCMRIKRFNRLKERKKSKIPPAAWQEFIEI